MRRKTPLKRSRKPLKRSKLKRVSSKQKGRMELYYQIRNAYIRSNPVCQICLVRPATDVHHRKYRFGNLLFDTRWFMALCRSCHSKVHGDIRNAKRMGWIVRY